MKNYIGVITMLVVLAFVSAAFSFESSDYFQYGRQDNEYTMAVVGAFGKPIYAGQWVGMSVADNQSLDTCAVVRTIATENTGLIIGVAEQSGDTGTMIRILTHGYTTAYINGTDSNVVGITNGSLLAQSANAGAAGGVRSYNGASIGDGGATTMTSAAYAYKVVGVALWTVGSDATADSAVTPALSTRYPVFVTCR